MNNIVDLSSLKDREPSYDDLTPEQQEELAAKAEETSDGDVLPVRTAFLVVLDNDGNVQVTPNLDTRVERQHMPSADEVYGIYFGENWISISRSADYDKTIAAIAEMVDGYPGLYRDLQTYLKERIREVLTGASDAIDQVDLLFRPVAIAVVLDGRQVEPWLIVRTALYQALVLESLERPEPSLVEDGRGEVANRRRKPPRHWKKDAAVVGHCVGGTEDMFQR